MTGMVARIEELVGEQVGRLWPDCVTVPVVARPLLDLTLGDFGIDCCLGIGATRKESPEAIAQDIVRALPAGGDYRFAAVEGFINVTVRDPVGLLRDVSARSVVAPHRILVQPLTESVAPDAVARLLGSAYVQCALARKYGGECELYLGGAHGGGGGSAGACARLLAGVTEMTARGALAEVKRVLGTPWPGGTTVWIAPTFLGKGEFRDLYREFFAGPVASTLRCPVRGWLEGFQESWWDILKSGQDWRSACLMLASSRSPAELDPLALTLAEQGNLRWFLRSTRERLQRLPRLEVPRGVPGEGELSAQARRVAIRAATVRLFEVDAIRRGEVTPWLDAVTDLLRGVNEWMNRPDRRRAFESGTVSPHEYQILSGATEAISDIINGNPLFDEEPCA
jgi:hypothetical protein